MSVKVACCAGVSAILIFLAGVRVGALPNPLNKPPSYAKLNSVTVKGHAKASAGQALVADGATGTLWANVEGLDIASQVSGSPASNGAVLTANGLGQARWVSPNIAEAARYTDVKNGSVDDVLLVNAKLQSLFILNTSGVPRIEHLPHGAKDGEWIEVLIPPGVTGVQISVDEPGVTGPYLNGALISPTAPNPDGQGCDGRFIFFAGKWHLNRLKGWGGV